MCLPSQQKRWHQTDEGFIFDQLESIVILFIVRVQDICINYNAGNIGKGRFKKVQGVELDCAN